MQEQTKVTKEGSGLVPVIGNKFVEWIEVQGIILNQEEFLPNSVFAILC